MGLFDQIINAIDDPHQQASSGQLGDILNTVQQLSNSTGTNPSTVQSLLSVVGSYTRSALQEKRNTAGDAEAQAFVNQYSGTSANPQAVQSLFPPFLQDQIVQVAAQRTGMNPGMIQQLLPVLVPIVLSFLRSGANAQNPHGGGNPVLNTFLDSDRDGDVDIADAMQLAGRYLGR